MRATACGWRLGRNRIMQFRIPERALATLCATAALLAGITTSTRAATFAVSTTIGASCVINNGSLVALTPTYSGSSDVSVGSAMTLNTTCNDASPSLAFTDATGAGTVFIMHAGAAVLNFQISNGTSCTGIVADTALPQATQQAMLPGVGQVYNICAAVIVGQRLAALGAYSDVVTLTITAG
jgi:hypothetical protein